jgi:hypothetical protein
MIKEYKTKIFLILGIFLFSFILFQPVFATDKYWIGSGSINSGENWSSSGVPNSLDTAIFNGGGVSNSTIDTDFSVKEFNIGSVYTGSIFLNYGKSLNLGNFQTPMVVSSAGSQVSTTSYPLSDIYLGGGFTFNKVGSTVTTNIVITQKGSLNADANLANLKLYYKKETTCSSSFPSGTTQFNSSGVSFSSNIATTTGNMTVDSSGQVCVYAKYDITGSTPPDQSLMGQTVDLEILNPSTDVLTNPTSTSSPATAIDISGATTLVIPSTATTSVSPIVAMLSLEMSDTTKNPTVFYLQDGALWIKEGVNGTPGKLTSDTVEVTSLKFTTLTGFLSTLFGSLKIEMTIKAKNSGETQEYNVERTFTTTVKVRKR